MTTQLYIHIGPYKTGTTSVQEHFWQNRQAYKDHGLLYPQTGILKKKWGHRHYYLATTTDPDLWQSLGTEIESSGVGKTLLSAERFSMNLSRLGEAAPLIRPYQPKIIIVLRPEAKLVSSMYLQLVKSYFGSPTRKSALRASFQDWFQNSQRMFLYSRMVTQAAKAFGEENIIYVRFGKSSNFNIVDEICRTLDVPVLERVSNQNLSISPSTARKAVSAHRFGWLAGKVAMETNRKLENMFPSLGSKQLEGFDAKTINELYIEKNQKALKRFPEFAKHYYALHDLAD